MYQFKSRIRYSETDETGRLSVPGIINYMQDCSTFQSEDGRMGISYLKEHHRAWLLSGWRIVIDRYPKLGEEITAGTWHCGSKGFYGYRDFVLLDQENNPLVRANSLWFFYDTEKICRCGSSQKISFLTEYRSRLRIWEKHPERFSFRRNTKQQQL